MSTLNRETVEKIAELAKLKLTEAEIELFGEQLGAVLDYADILSGLDTDDIPPTASVLPLVNAFREDAILPSLPNEQALANAPKARDGMFSVHAVLDSED